MFEVEFLYLFSHIKMSTTAQFPPDLVTFTEEIVSGKLHFLYNVGRKMKRRNDGEIENIAKTLGVSFSKRQFSHKILHKKIKFLIKDSSVNMNKSA